MRAFLTLVIPITIISCTADRFHASGRPDMSVYDADRTCYTNNFEDRAKAASNGVLGLVASSFDSPTDKDRIYNDCMARHNWVRNQ